MSTTTTTTIAPPPFAQRRPTRDDAIYLCTLALMVLAMIFYLVLKSLKCPLNPFRRSTTAPPPPRPEAQVTCGALKVELSCAYNYVTAEDDEECPVCLSTFDEGEEVKKMTTCGHMFHVACIDMWLYSHWTCSVCRAMVALVKRSKRPVEFVDYRQAIIQIL